MERILSIKSCFKHIYVVTGTVDHPLLDNVVWDIDITVLGKPVQYFISYARVKLSNSVNAYRVVGCMKPGVGYGLGWWLAIRGF